MARCLNEYGAPYNALSQEVRAATAQISHYHNFSIRYDQRSSVVLSPQPLGLFACSSNRYIMVSVSADSKADSLFIRGINKRLFTVNQYPDSITAIIPTAFLT